ncbi:hypothetical protein Hanom_Chr06g00561551 [Helianthus anomalus]
MQQSPERTITKQISLHSIEFYIKSKTLTLNCSLRPGKPDGSSETFFAAKQTN